MKKLFVFVSLVAGANAHAWDLHYGEYAVGLTETKNTSPALHIRLNENEIIYGAMYDAAGAPKNTIRIMFEGTEYFVGNWCDAGKYHSSDKLECVDCGIGHYCTGGVHRAPCAGGAIACPGKNHTADAVADASLVNKILSLDEVNEHIPTTDWSDWKLVNCCATKVATQYNNSIKSDLNQIFEPDVGGCPVTQFGPGTYLFASYTSANYGRTCPQAPETIITTIAVINQPSSYKQIHASNVYYTYVDTTSTEFNTIGFRANPYDYCETHNDTNVSNIDLTPAENTMCVYELK